MHFLFGGMIYFVLEHQERKRETGVKINPLKCPGLNSPAHLSVYMPFVGGLEIHTTNSFFMG